MRHKKIAILINSLDMGGAERVASLLCEQAVNVGADIELICLEDKIFYQLPKNMKIVTLARLPYGYIKPIKLLELLYFSWQLKTIVRKHKIDTVVSFLIRSDCVNNISKIIGSKHKTVISVRTTIGEFYAKQTIVNLISKLAVKLIYPLADCIIAPSKGILYDLNKIIGLKCVTHVVPNPINMRKIGSLANFGNENAFDFKKEKFYIAYLGRLIRLKNVHDIIASMSKLNDNIELLIIGDGDERQSLVGVANSFNISSRVHFVGSSKNPFAILKHCNLLVLASNMEGFPNVLIEGMACGCAIISSDCKSGPREILAPNTDINVKLEYGFEKAEFGILYAISDVLSLSAAIKLLFDDECLLAHYKSASNRRARDFAIPDITDKFLKVVENV
jgi:N-acetylgalactosamine-N,N'-diacetylbacillosaminyl-diphospho-undecaprenol 4-alpha-N-acetylgalactosaminyltransferase